MSMFPNAVRKTFTYGSHQVTLETGEIARQAHGAVLVSMDDTVVLCTVVAAKNPKPGQSAILPSVWVVKHPQARVVCIALGHDEHSHDHPAYQKILLNSLKWVQGK